MAPRRPKRSPKTPPKSPQEASTIPPRSPRVPNWPKTAQRASQRPQALPHGPFCFGLGEARKSQVVQGPSVTTKSSEMPERTPPPIDKYMYVYTCMHVALVDLPEGGAPRRAFWCIIGRRQAEGGHTEAPHRMTLRRVAFLLALQTVGQTFPCLDRHPKRPLQASMRPPTYYPGTAMVWAEGH